MRDVSVSVAAFLFVSVVHGPASHGLFGVRVQLNVSGIDHISLLLLIDMVEHLKTVTSQ